MRTKANYIFTVDINTMTEFKKIAKDADRKFSQIVNRLISEYVAKHKKK